MTPIRTALIQTANGVQGHYCPTCWALRAELRHLTFIEQASTPGPDRYVCEGGCGKEAVCDHTTHRKEAA